MSAGWLVRIVRIGLHAQFSIFSLRQHAHTRKHTHTNKLTYKHKRARTREHTHAHSRRVPCSVSVRVKRHLCETCYPILCKCYVCVALQWHMYYTSYLPYVWGCMYEHAAICTCMYYHRISAGIRLWKVCVCVCGCSYTKNSISLNMSLSMSSSSLAAVAVAATATALTFESTWSSRSVRLHANVITTVCTRRVCTWVRGHITTCNLSDVCKCFGGGARWWHANV